MGEDQVKCFLVIAGCRGAVFEPFDTIGDAKRDFVDAATQLAGFGQTLRASLHIAKTVEAVSDYPDYVLSLGPRGALRCDRT